MDLVPRFATPSILLIRVGSLGYAIKTDSDSILILSGNRFSEGNPLTLRTQSSSALLKLRETALQALVSFSDQTHAPERSRSIATRNRPIGRVGGVCLFRLFIKSQRELVMQIRAVAEVSLKKPRVAFRCECASMRDAGGIETAAGILAQLD